MKMTQQGWGLGFFVLLSIIMLTNVYVTKNDSNESARLSPSINSEREPWHNPLNDYKLVDNKQIYIEDRGSGPDQIFVTVLPPRSHGALTFSQLNSHSYNPEAAEADSLDPTAEIIFETGKPGSYRASELQPNASLELRGQTARYSSQKSYKIKLYKDTDSWLGQDIINLNKHFDDPLRVRNKLSFDLFQMIRDITRLRTRFVQLYIKDRSLPQPDADFKYYGLYTFVEQPNKSFLDRHLLDRKAHLYKAEFFEFERYQEAIKNSDNPAYNNQEFEKYLEIIGSRDHKKIIDMLEEVNNYNKDINLVVDKNFDRANLLTWLAANILLDNYDSNSRNYLLYSPQNSDKWFFLPWDYDGIWLETAARGKWERGLANYWGMVLFNRFFRDPRNTEELSDKIEELSGIINKENTRRLLESYYGAVTGSIFVPPDEQFLSLTKEEYPKKYYELTEMAEKAKKYYFSSLENPMPFYMGDPVKQNREYVFIWDASYDLQNDELSYHFMLSRDPDFRNMEVSYSNLLKTTCSVGNLKPGRYYFKVIASDAKGNWQSAFDNCQTLEGRILYGVKTFIVP